MESLQSSSSSESGEDVETPVFEPVDDEEPLFEAKVIETVSVVSQDGAHVLPTVDLDADTRPTIMSSRAYQKEMLDQSLKRNIIVAVCHRNTRRLVADKSDGYRKWKDSGVRYDIQLQ